jgi:uncharacterized protein YegL
MTPQEHYSDEHYTDGQMLTPVDVGPIIESNLRTPCILLIDNSDSMSGRKIRAVNNGLRTISSGLEEDPTASISVEVSIVTFGGTVDLVQPFSTVREFTPPDLKASGGTPMDEALGKSLDYLAEHKTHLRQQGVDYHRPWLWLFTDGYPTDDYAMRKSKSRLHEAIDGGHVVFFAIGAETEGSGVNWDLLRELSTQRSPRKISDLSDIQEMFRWLGNSLTMKSRSLPGQQIDLGWGDPV